MATMNYFNLLDDDAEDPSVFLANQELKAAANAAANGGGAVKKGPPATANGGAKPGAKLPTKPLPHQQAVREARNEGGRGYGRGPGGANTDLGYYYVHDVYDINQEEAFRKWDAPAKLEQGPRVDKDKPSDRDVGYGGPRGGYREGRRGGYANGDAAGGERPRRVLERRSGTGRGVEMKREGAGRGNWGTATDELTQITEESVVENEAVAAEKPAGEEENVDAVKENPEKDTEEAEPEEKQMTLEEYEKVLEEKRKALLSLKGEERKVDVDKEFESMQLVSKKKNDDEVFIKLGSEKDKRREAAEKEERARKSVSINEFLKTTEGNGYNRRGGRGRGRGKGGYRGYDYNNVPAPKIEDPSQFPTLGAN